MTRSSTLPTAIAFSLLISAGAHSGGRDQLAIRRASHQIQAILDSISAANIRSYLDTLEGFQFRHTMDDTLSPTTGMGAARRWVHRKFQEFSAASGGRLQPMYFDFTATICGISRLHRNVMAILPGTLTPDRYFIVSGHLDTRGDPNNACAYGIFSPGAVDDGSGTAVSIELARVMSQYQFDASLIFMAVTGEDEGLFGSEAYAAYAQNIGQRIDGMITNDVVGNIVGQNGITDSTSARHYSSVSDTTSHRQLARYIKLTSEFYYPVMTINLIPAVDRPGRGGDHQSFQNHGYTAVRFVEPNENFNNQHTPTDLVANMSPAYNARIARVNAAGLASLAWAPERPVPPTLLDPGTGTTLVVQLPPPQNQPDFAGHRIAVRDSGGLFYTSVIDAGSAAYDTIGGLTPGVSVYVGVSAYDTAGNESFFSREVLALPNVAPSAPVGIRSTSFPTNAHLSWQPNTQLDVTKYRVYRSISRTSGFGMYDSVLVPGNEFSDFNMSPDVLYFYQVRAVDTDGNESLSSSVVTGQRVTHDAGVLIVDGTRDGAPAPPDSVVDQFYQSLLSGFLVAGEWDIADSLASNISVSDAELGRYSTLVWHTDVRNSAPVSADTVEIREYLQQGGRFFLGGWRLSGSFMPGVVPGVNSFPPGSFVPVFLKVDSVYVSGPLTADFARARAELGSYSDVNVDSAKIPIGGIVNTDAVLPPFAGPGVDMIFSHHGRLPGSLLEGKPVGWRYLGSDFKVVVFDFPLYYMKQSEGRAALRQALMDLGEVVSVQEPPGTTPERFELYQNFPNPFNPSTEIRFDLPAKSELTLVVYNLLGQAVRTLVNEERPAGSHNVRWDGRNDGGRSVSSGVYFYRFSAMIVDGAAAGYIGVRKMLYLR